MDVKFASRKPSWSRIYLLIQSLSLPLTLLYRVVNFLFSTASSLQCYGCFSTVSWESCDKNSEILQCDPGLQYCVKLDYSLKSTGLEDYNFLKACSSDCDKRDFSHCLKGQSYESKKKTMESSLMNINIYIYIYIDIRIRYKMDDGLIN